MESPIKWAWCFVANLMAATWRHSLGTFAITTRWRWIPSDAGPRVVRAYTIQTAGAGYKAEIRNMLTTTNTWFRPSDLCVAPDGSVYVADWNDAGVGGHNMADQKVAEMTGRIYRIATK